jgi:hypothetical protein
MLDRRGHLTECAFVSYLVGDVDEADAARVEEHVTACRLCAARLQEEARLEVALYEAAELGEDAVVPIRRRWERVAVTATAVVSVAAALVLALGDPARWIDVHLGGGDGAHVAVQTQDVTPATDDGTCVPPMVDDEEDCEPEELYALATFPTTLATFPEDPLDALDVGPLCEDDADTGPPICHDG